MLISMEWRNSAACVFCAIPLCRPFEEGGERAVVVVFVSRKEEGGSIFFGKEARWHADRSRRA
jgi:hypothetical protein